MKRVVCFRAFGLLMTTVVSFPAQATQVQHVPVTEDPSTQPQIEVSGVGIATLGYGRSLGHPNGEAGINFSDSALFLGAAQRLYDGGGIGSFGIGGLTTEESNRGTGTVFFLHQAFLDYQAESFEAFVGRTDNPVAHWVDFPTLRSDDLITLTTPLDPFSNGGNIEEHRYSNVASLTFNQGLKFYENIHAQHLINSAGFGSSTGINSFGASVEYLGSPGMEAFQTFPSLEVGYEHLTLTSLASSGLNRVLFGGVLNLNESVTDRFDVRLQEVLSIGSDLKAFQILTDTFQADANAVTVSLRFLHSPFGRPGYQLAVTGSLKNYLNVSDANSAGWALTGVKRLGQGFDWVAQYQGQWRSPTLVAMQAAGVAYEQVAEMGFVYNFDSVFNQHLSPRRSLLNQKHQYIPD